MAIFGNRVNESNKELEDSCAAMNKSLQQAGPARRYSAQGRFFGHLAIYLSASELNTSVIHVTARAVARAEALPVWARFSNLRLSV